jgi:septal ring factor EnvC (AmiA/AmiB activator)
VEAGQRVAGGQEIGRSGASVEGAGLYFEVRFQGRPEDPLGWLRGGETGKPQGMG